MNEKDIINEALAWAEGTHCAITVCDLEGKVIFMNERSRATFDKDGRTMLGQDGKVCGMVEISMVIPQEMPHYVRK